MNIRRFVSLGCPMLLPCLILTGCQGFSGPPDVSPAHSGVVSLNPQAWYIMWGSGMPEHPSPSTTGAWFISLPNAPNSIHYVQTPYTAAPSLPSKVSITFRIDSSSNADYNGEVDPNAGNPATFHVFLERQGDDFTQDYYRWWADDGGYVFGSKDNSDITLEVPLSSDDWSSVYGHHNSAEFAATLNRLAWVGMTFGGQYFWGHGVNMLAGTSTFKLIDFRVE